MNYKIDYLLRYVSNETYKKILKNKSDYVLSLVENNYIDTDLNIKYLIKYGQMYLLLLPLLVPLQINVVVNQKKFLHLLWKETSQDSL